MSDSLETLLDELRPVFADAADFARARRQWLAGLLNLGRHTVTGALSSTLPLARLVRLLSLRRSEIAAAPAIHSRLTGRCSCGKRPMAIILSTAPQPIVCTWQ